MAIIKRMRSDGTTAYTVQWVLGGGRKTPDKMWQTETFNSPGRAEDFEDRVKAAGHQWPPGWVKGEGDAPAKTATSAPTFSDVAASYVTAQEKRVKRGLKKPYTMHRDQAAIAIHLEPTFGDLDFTTIETDDVSDWIDIQLDLGAAPKSIRNRHGLLFSIMAHGQKAMKLRVDNPCELTELPASVNKRNIRFFQEGEWALLRACLSQDVHLLADVLLSTAMRWGEVTALRVTDCTISDEQTVHIQIVQAWSKRAPDDPAPIRPALGENRSWVLGAPKNERGRVVTVHGEVGRQLIAAITGRHPGSYVFTTREGNPWRYPDFHTDRWLPAVADAKRRGLVKHATVHMLRHTAVVWALARGIKIQVVSEMLGHASIQITYDTYGGLVNVHDPEMAKAMAQALISVQQAITPAPTRADVEARKIRPGARGTQRKRVSA